MMNINLASGFPVGAQLGTFYNSSALLSYMQIKVYQLI